jgi:hypothetical protein
MILPERKIRRRINRVLLIQPTLRDYGMCELNASGGGARSRAIHHFVR